MHGNAGCRLESLPLLNYLIPKNIGNKNNNIIIIFFNKLNKIKMQLGLCSFDFSGCGNSEGDIVTLGLKEVDDLKSIINNLRQ